MFNKIKHVIGLFVLSIFIATIPAGHALAIGGQEITILSNSARQASGIKKLAWNARLANSAYQKASDMCSKDYWAHQSPTGKTAWDFISAAGYSYRTAGENLARGFTSDSGVVSGWLASPGHRQNLMNSSYSETGVGIKVCTMSGKKTTVVVAHYAQPLSQPKPTATSTVQNTKPRTTSSQPKTIVTRTTSVKPVVQKVAKIKPVKKSVKRVKPSASKPRVLTFGQLLISLLESKDTNKLNQVLPDLE